MVMFLNYGVWMILGVVWLETLGKVTLDWKEISMVFNHGGQLVKLKGQQIEEKSVNFKSLVSLERIIEGCGSYKTMMVKVDMELKKKVFKKRSYNNY